MDGMNNFAILRLSGKVGGRQMSEVALTVSKRIHRVFHRLGVVLGGMLVLAGLAVGANASITWMRGPAAPELKLVPYDGPAHPLSSGEEVDLQLKADRAEAIAAAQNRRQVHELGVMALFLMGCGLATYLALRAIGWIVAGAAKS
ncbi:hypothetical protein ACFWXH_10540 [Mesorhizobium sp. NPDC059054]|uniref:hypothetical protein n=1 Tax=Mesorhizobium sp. NPDC059054 TaxID=3346711 RepID=UPI0036C2B138